MPVDNLIDRLAQQNDAWKQAKVTEPGELPDDGTYQAIVDRFDFFEAKSTGDLFLKTETSVQFPEEQKGWPIEFVHNLSNPERLPWAKKHLKTLGIELDDLSELEQRLPEALDVPVEIVVKTSEKTDSDGNHYRNAYLNQRLGDPLRERTDVPVDPPARQQQTMDKDGDPIPF